LIINSGECCASGNLSDAIPPSPAASAATRALGAASSSNDDRESIWTDTATAMFYGLLAVMVLGGYGASLAQLIAG
jgi:hypothetical protein